MLGAKAKEKKVKRVIALAHKPQYKPIIEKIGVDSVLNPRSAMVDEIIRCTLAGTLLGINIMEGGRGRMMEFVIRKKTKIVGRPLSKVTMPKQTLIGAIVRGDKLIIPRGGDHLEVGDHIVVFTTRSLLSQVKQLFS